MAQRRMFNKTIVHSSKFLKMPVSSRCLYYDLGMSADDDGYAEHFTVMRMTGASQQDLGVLEINGFIKIFDENVLIITNWKENNYIQKDRYTPSKYLAVYKMDKKCIQGGEDTDTQSIHSLGKYNDRKIDINNIIQLDNLKLIQMQNNRYDEYFKEKQIYIANLGIIPEELYRQIKLYQNIVAEIIDTKQLDAYEKITFTLLEKTYGQVMKVESVDNIVSYFKSSLLNEIIKRGV
jgi:prolyl-tRNA synthetase